MNSETKGPREDQDLSTAAAADAVVRYKWVAQSLAAKLAKGDLALQDDLFQVGLSEIAVVASSFIPGKQSLGTVAYDRAHKRMLDFLSRNMEDSSRFVSMNEVVGHDESGPLYLGDSLEDPEDGPEETLLKNERDAVVREIVAALPIKDRTVIQMVIFDECSQEQVATVLGVSQMMVSKYLAQALDKVKTRLAARGF